MIHHIMAMDWTVRKEIPLIILSVMICWKQSLALMIRCHGKCLERHPVVSNSAIRLFATKYTIEEEGVYPEVLCKTVHKHFENLNRFLDSKPVADHTQEAFSTLESMLNESMGDAPIILDR